MNGGLNNVNYADVGLYAAPVVVYNDTYFPEEHNTFNSKLLVAVSDARGDGSVSIAIFDPINIANGPVVTYPLIAPPGVVSCSCSLQFIVVHSRVGMQTGLKVYGPYMALSPGGFLVVYTLVRRTTLLLMFSKAIPTLLSAGRFGWKHVRPDGAQYIRQPTAQQ